MANSRRAAQARKRQSATEIERNEQTTDDAEKVIEQVTVANNTFAHISEAVNLILDSPVRSNTYSNNAIQTQIEDKNYIRSADADRRKRRCKSIQLSTGGSDLTSFGHMIKEADTVRADVVREKLTF